MADAQIINFQFEKLKRQLRYTISATIEMIDVLMEEFDKFGEDVFTKEDANRHHIGFIKLDQVLNSRSALVTKGSNEEKMLEKYIAKDMAKLNEAKKMFYDKFGYMIEDE